MKINFGQVIRDFEDHPIEIDVVDGEKTKKVPLTLKKVCVDALHYEKIDPNTRQPSATGEQRFERFRLGMLVSKQKSGPVELEAKDILLLKTAVGDAWPSPEVVGRAWEMLEMKDQGNP